MKLAFISDLHLSVNTPIHTQKFAELMEKFETEIDELYILGDFFDYWLGDDDNNEFIREIKYILKSFTQVKPIYFMGGNHDFAVGNQFAKDTGITLIKDLTCIEVGSNRILLSHGDVFCTLDTGYQNMKKILQNPIVMTVLRRLPLSFRYKLKNLLKKKSDQKFNKSQQDPRYTEDRYMVVDNVITKIANKCGANIVVHGHTHRPGKYIIKSDGDSKLDTYCLVRFELPDWIFKAGGYLLIEDDLVNICIAK